MGVVRNTRLVTNTFSSKHLNETISLNTATLRFVIEQYWNHDHKPNYLEHIGLIISIASAGISIGFIDELRDWRWALVLFFGVAFVASIICIGKTHKAWHKEKTMTAESEFEDIYKQRIK